MEITILDADFDDPAHRAAIVELIDSYARDSFGLGAPLRPEVRERLVPALREHPSRMVLIAFTGGRAIGIAVCFLGISTFQARALVNVHDLAVLPEYRGRGVGRALLQAVEDRARRSGCCKLTLEVQDENTRARAIYERFGFGDFVLGEATGTRFLAKPLQ